MPAAEKKGDYDCFLQDNGRKQNYLNIYKNGVDAYNEGIKTSKLLLRFRRIAGELTAIHPIIRSADSHLK